MCRSVKNFNVFWRKILFDNFRHVECYIILLMKKILYSNFSRLHADLFKNQIYYLNALGKIVYQFFYGSQSPALSAISRAHNVEFDASRSIARLSHSVVTIGRPGLFFFRNFQDLSINYTLLFDFLKLIYNQLFPKLVY